MKKRVNVVISIFLALLLLFQPMTVGATVLLTDETEPYAEDLLPDAEPEEVTDEAPEGKRETVTLGEITEDRTGNTKTFSRSDGTKMVVVYPENVHFTDENGTFVDYDNTLVDSESDGEPEYAATQSDVDFRISKKTNGKKLVRVTKGGYTLSWNFEGIKKRTGAVSKKTYDDAPETLENFSSEVFFSDVFADTDLQYVLQGSEVKENLILTGKRSPSDFSVNYKYSGLAPALSEDQKTITLNDASGEEIFIIEAPFAVDNNGESNTDLYFELTNIKNNGFTAVLHLDRAWLDEEDRAYPVTVDPILFTKQELTSSCSQSAFVASGTPTATYGRGGSNYAGSLYAGYYSNLKILRSYVQFSLPTLGKADRVVNATMFAYLNRAGDITVTLHKVNAAWQESTICWNNKPACETSIVREYKVLSESSSEHFIDFDITQQVIDWYAGDNNYGLMLKSTNESPSNVAWFFSTGYTTYSDMRPIVAIEYRNLAGYEDYNTYYSVEAGRGGMASVNTFNGNLVASLPVTLDAGGERMPINISAVYNANKTHPVFGRLGKGWQLSHQVYVRQNTNQESYSAGYRYYYNDADGTQHYFYFEENDNTGKDEDGLGYTLQVTTNSMSTGGDTQTNRRNTERYILKDSKDNEIVFNDFGNPMRIADACDNAIIYQYESVMVDSSPQERVTRLTDGAGRIYLFTYHSNTSLYVTKITDAAGRWTKFESSNAYLNKITYYDGKTVTFSYEAELLATITNLDNTVTTVSYGTGNRHVQQIKRTSGNTTDEKYTFAYKHNYTEITDKQNRKTTYQFNNYGQTTGIVSNNSGEAAAYSYVEGNWPENKSANKMLSSSKTQKSVKNYVKNSGVDNGLSPFYKRNGAGDGNGVLSVDTTYGHFSNTSLKVEKSATDAGTVHVLQKVYVPAGTYTVSAFISTKNVAISRNAAVLFAEAVNTADSTFERKYGEAMQFTGDGEWVRKSVTITIEEGQYLRFAAGFDSSTYGTLWIDDIQVEEGYGVSGYNILENPEFLNDVDGWTVDASSYSITNTSLSGLTKSVRLNTSVGGTCSISQSVPFNGSKGQVFSIGAWANAYSVPTLNSKVFSGNQYASFKLSVSLFRGSRSAGYAEAKYNPNLSVFQFQSMRVVATNVFDRVEVTFTYDHNCNQAYLTGVYCIPEEYGETYTYDNNGNLISAASVSGGSSGYGYASNNLVASASETGAQNFIGYTSKHDVTAAVNTSRGMYKLSRNDVGNVTKATVQPARRVTEIEVGKTYFFVNVQTGMALYAKNDTLGSSVVNHSFNKSQVRQRWTVEAGANAGEYRLKVTLGDTDAYLGMQSAGTGYGIKCITVSANAAAGISTFKLEAGENGTFAFFPKSSGYENALDALYTSSEIEENHEIRQFFAFPTRKAQYWYVFEYREIGVTDGDIYYDERYTYDDTNNFVTSHTDIANQITTYNYNTSSGLLSSVTNPKNVVTQYTYNSMGMVTGVQSGAQSVGYTYTNDRLTGVSVTNGSNYTFTYDSFGRLTRTDMGTHVLSRNSYNDSGLLSSSKYTGDEVYTNYTYDSLDRMSGKAYNGNQINYYYGADGLLAQTTDTSTNSRNLYVYDQAGRVVARKEFSGTDISSNSLKSSLSYTYMPGDSRISSIGTYTALGENTLSFTYGKLENNAPTDNVYQEKWNGVKEKANSYDALNRRYKYTLYTPSNVTMAVTYSFREINSTKNRQSSQVSQLATPAGTYEYTYDVVGNILTEKLGSNTTSYVYDNDNRLIRENNQRAGKTYVYTYTAAGDITSRKTYAYTTGTLGTVQTTDSYTYSNGLLMQYKDNAISYSGARMTGFGSYTVDWYKSGLLSNYSKTGETHTYTYSMDGLRLSKTDNGATTNFYYAGDLLIGQKKGNNPLVFKFDHSGDYYGFTYGGSNYWYIKNLQNDVVAIANDAGTIVVRYYYDAWGRLLSTTDTSGANIGAINPIRYRSYYYDTETGFYFLQSRYYNPEIGRFLSVDDSAVITASPMALTDKNLFAYCDNNPVLRVDAGGECWHIIAGAFIGGVTSFISNYSADENHNVGNALISAAFGAASGALCAAIPAAAIAIDAAFSAAESITMGIIQDKNFATIAVDTAISVGFSMLTCGKGEVLAEKSTYVAINTGRNAVKNAYRPSIKKTAQKQLNKTVKRIIKNSAFDQIETVAFTTLELGTKKLIGHVYNLDF